MADAIISDLGGREFMSELPAQVEISDAE